MTRAGTTHSGVPSFRCAGCGRRSVAAPRKGPVSDDRKARVERLPGERLSLRAVARVTGRPRSRLQALVDRLYAEGTPRGPGPVGKRPAAW